MPWEGEKVGALAIRIALDQPVAGMRNGVGRFVHGGGQGPDRAGRPVPLYCQVLDPQVFDLAFAPGDPVFEVLTDDQKRFCLPAALPPILSLLDPLDPANPTGCHVIARPPYSDGAYQLLQDLLDERHYRFSLTEFLRITTDLASALEFLHEHQIAHGQWNCRSVVCVPVPSREVSLQPAPSYDYHLLNTGVRYLDPSAIPPEYLARDCFPPEIIAPSTGLPDYEAFHLEADVYCFCAFFRDIFQRASGFEDLAQQARTIREIYCRRAMRSGSPPGADVLRRKEQEILDHIYTIKVEVEGIIESGLRERGRRSKAGDIHRATRDLREKWRSYARLLYQSGLEDVDVFADALRHYMPFEVGIDPERVNRFDETRITIRGKGLPCDVVRVSLGEQDLLLDVEEATPTLIRARVPLGCPRGEHLLLINNRRTNCLLTVVEPEWQRIEPESVRQPWEGFGNIRVTISGNDLPSEPRFALRSLGAETESGAMGDAGEPEEDDIAGDVEAVSVLSVDLEATGETEKTDETDGSRSPGATREGEKEEEEDATTAPEEEVRPPARRAFAVEFPPETPVGAYALLAGGLETGLHLSIEDALTEPEIESRAEEPLQVLNHREARLHLRGRNLHPLMVVDLGEEGPGGTRFEIDPGSDRGGFLVLPADAPPGEYRLRVNRKETGVWILVRQPTWTACEPAVVTFPRRRPMPAAVRIEGADLPPVDPAGGDLYRLRTRRGRRLAPGLVEAEVVEEEAVHALRVSAEVPRGRFGLHFGGKETGLRLRVKHPVPRFVAAGLWFLGLVVLVAAGSLLVRELRPTVTEVLTPRVFNFVKSQVEIKGSRLQAVVLEARPPPAAAQAREIPVAPLAAGKDTYAFDVAGVSPGEYTIIPRGRLLRGAAAEGSLTILSPAFRVEPAVFHRLVDTVITVLSEGGFPLEEVEPHELRLVPLSAGGAAPAAFPLDEAGRVSIPPGTFGEEDEGSYNVSLGARLLGPELVRGGEPLLVQVVGPQVEAVDPPEVTASRDGQIAVRLLGSSFPAGGYLGLVRREREEPAEVEPEASGSKEVPKGGEDAPKPEEPGAMAAVPSVAFRLGPAASGDYRGHAEPGSYSLLWDLPGGAVEAIPSLRLDVLPPPLITSVAPETLRPGVPVRLELTGVNLRAAGEISLTPLTLPRGSGEAVTLPVATGNVSQDPGGRARYRTAPLTLGIGRYRLSPARGVTLEVVENCEKLLAAYRRDLDRRDELLRCLREEHPDPATRKLAAGVFFDQGLFDEALVVYSTLDDLESRFRTALLRGSRPEGGPADFQPRPGDPDDDPYVLAARALGWVAGKRSPLPRGPGQSWELDFVRGHVASDPYDAVNDLRLSIEKKRAAALVQEVAPFAPALADLARAHLGAGLALLAAGTPLQALEYLRRHFFAEENLGRLTVADRAIFHFYYGHMLLWYTGDERGAEGQFREGMASGGLSYRGLCSMYLQALGRRVARETDASSLQATLSAQWERSFVTVFAAYRQILSLGNYRLLTESTGFGRLTSAEQRMSVILFKAIATLEKAKAPPDPFAQSALLYSLRNAQRLSWPREKGGARAAGPKSRLETMTLQGAAAELREFYLVEAEIEPLEPSQVVVLTGEERQILRQRLQHLLARDLPGFFKNRLARLRETLRGF